MCVGGEGAKWALGMETNVILKVFRLKTVHIHYLYSAVGENWVSPIPFNINLYFYCNFHIMLT